MDVFGGAPRFLAYPRPVVVQSGTDAVLKCQIGGDPRPAVIWERNNEKIHPGGRYRVFEDGNVYNLIITLVTVEDSGQYICKAKNCIGETYAAATLKVEGEAQEMEVREENKPRFLIKPLSTRVGRGEDAVFSCKLWGKPRPEVVWEKDGKKLNEIFESTHFSVGYQDGGWFQLKIFKTRAPDGGVYTCKARNEFGESLAGAVLLVDAGPGHEDEGNRNGYTNSHWKAQQGKQRSSRQVAMRLKDDPVPSSAKVKMFAVTEGKHAKFRCYVTGKPKPEIIWRKDGRIILSGRRYLLYEDREGYFTLKVLYCKQQDNGLYVCAASNSAGQTLSAVHLSVKEPPVKFKQPLNDLEVWEQDLAILECEVPEDSVPITWYLEDRRLQPGAKYGMEEWGTKRRLTIRDMGVDDDGIYLCEMPDGGRSIAEVTVKGTIVRKLPRKVDVLEGENAAFCVEVEEEEMDIHWYKDGIELRETHQTIIKSFGRTHILVFVNTTPLDSGMVIFYVGRSKTSSQLRVKAIRHCPPSFPVGVQINTERANAALLSWVPAQDCRKNPPSGYILERQEMGSQEWLQCLTTDSATAVEILGDSVPCEADYRFRICSVNKYGRSGYVEFPRSVHLVPVAKIQAPLQDALVPENQDACFSIELSAFVIGTWFWNGNQIQEDERFTIRRSRTHQSLRIRSVRDTDNGAEITFIAYGIRDSAALYIQAPLVKFTPLSEMDRNKFVEAGNPIVLYCELSDSEAPVRWYKNGIELHSADGLHIQSEGTMRRIVIQSAEFSHSGVYSCDAIDDVIRFNVEVEAPPVRFTELPEFERNKLIEAGCPIVLQCELSDPNAQVFWFKDGAKLLPQSDLTFKSDATKRALVIQKAEFFHSGVYSCKTKGAAVQFNVKIRAPPVRFLAIPECERRKCIHTGCEVVLQCEISDASEQVLWFKDGNQISVQSRADRQSDGCIRKLIIQTAALPDSGVYRCTTKDDIVEFQVEVKAVPVRFSAIPELERSKCIEAGSSFELCCEVSDPTALVCWYKGKTEILHEAGWDIQADGKLRMLKVHSADSSHSGLYSCAMPDDSVQFTVDIKAPPVKFPTFPEVVKNQVFEADHPTDLHCEISDPPAKVCSYKDGVELLSKNQPQIKKEDTKKLAVKTAQPSKSGQYNSVRMDADIQFNEQDEVAKMNISGLQESLDQKPTEAGCLYETKEELSETLEQKVQAREQKEAPIIHNQDERSVTSNLTSKKQFTQLPQTSKEEVQTTETEAQSMMNHEKVKAPSPKPVKFAPLPEAARTKTIDCGMPLVLQCEIFDPDAPVCWFKDGIQLQTKNGLVIQSEDCIRRLVVPTAELCHAGVYNCEAMDDVIKFKVYVKAGQQKSVAHPETGRKQMASSVLDNTSAPQSELETSTAQVCCYTKEEEEYTQTSLNVTQSEDTARTLVQSAEMSDSGVYSCETKNTNILIAVDLPVPPVTFSTLTETQKNKTAVVGEPFELECEVSDATAQVCWYKDKNELQSEEVLILSEGTIRKLFVKSAELSHSGTYSCKTNDDTITFNVEIKAPLLWFKPISEVERKTSIEVDSPVVLKHETADTETQNCWYKDVTEISAESGLNTQKDGNLGTLTVQSAELSDMGHYVCGSPDDAVSPIVDVQAAPIRFSELPEVARNKFIEAGCPIILQCEISDSDAQVSWFKDGVPLLQQTGLDIQSEDTLRTLIIQSAELKHSGVYSCEAVDDRIVFKVDVAVPPVTFVYIPDEELHKNIVEQENLFLCCEVSRSDATVQWYKDGTEIQPSAKFILETKSTIRKLTIQSVEMSDAGTYTCRAGDSALIFKVNVREPPIMIVYPKEDVHLERHVPEEIVLSCELSRPNGNVTWFKDGQKLQESANMKFKTEGPYRRLKILHSRVEDSGEYVCDTADDSKFFHLSITEPPVRIVSPSQSQMELCQQTSERMVLSCEISRPNASVRWYRDGLEVEENNNLILEVDGVYRRLIIPETTVDDSAEYVCDTADDSVTFFVNIAEPPVRFIRPRKMAYEVERFVGDTVVLDCEVSRLNAEVIWKKDGEDIEENVNITITEDGSVRQLTIHSSAVKDTGQYVCDAKDDVMDFHLRIVDPPLKFLGKNDIITDRHFVVSDAIVLKCELSRANGVVSWYKDNKRIVGNEHFTFEEQGTFRSLIILNAEINDTGEYKCNAKDDEIIFNVTVEEAPVSIIGNSGNPEHYSLVAGDQLILECEVSQENGIVQWLCNGRVLHADSRTHIESKGTMRKLVISSLQMSDSGEYICDAIDDKMTIMVTVQEPPFKFLKKEVSNIVAYDGEGVTLRAVVNRDNAPVKWRKDGEYIRHDRFCTTSDGCTHYLTINPLKKSDAGEYVCDVGTDKTNFKIQVKAMKVKFSKPLENAVGLTDSDIVLRCELYMSNGDVQWLKNNQEITPNRHFTIRADGRQRSLTIHNVTDNDAGEYTCESKDERTSATVVVTTPRVVEFIAELHNITVMEGEDATFKCVVSPEDTKLVWHMNGWPITSSERFNISSNGLCHMLYIRNCQVSDSCKLTVDAEGVISKASLRVQEAQVLFTQKLEPVVVEEFGEATLEVELSLESGEVQWMRQGVVIHPGSKFTLKQSGRKRFLTIHKLAILDRGTYSCETLHDRTQAQLSVEPRKVKIQKGLSEIQTYERETASFEVELSHSNVEGMWLKDGNRLKSNNRCRMTAKGHMHSLTISNLAVEDTGTYMFSAENARSSARLNVKETPVSILRKLEDITVPEGTGATLECELSRHNVNIKWTKNGVELKPEKNHRIYSMGRKCFLQIVKCEPEDSGVYICDAGDATTSCTVEVYERELEVLQSLEDLDIQEDQNAVFMCEVSLDDVPGEWFKNGEKIKPTSTIKIRQEGTKHFLLMCNVKREDSGEIKFTAKNVDSIAYLEVEKLPVHIVKPLQDKTALEKSRVILDCTVSNPRCSIRWYKGSNVILPSGRFEICSEGCYRKLVIQQVAMEDGGTYSVQVAENTSSAKLTVEAQSILMVEGLQDIEVTAPEEAQFMCEVSEPVASSHVWTLNGETLKPGPRVLLEKIGAVHRLTLRHTSEDMNGIVTFSAGNAKSAANLRVKK